MTKTQKERLKQAEDILIRVYLEMLYVAPECEVSRLDTILGKIASLSALAKIEKGG